MFVIKAGHHLSLKHWRRYVRLLPVFSPHLFYFLYNFWRGKAVHLCPRIGAATENSTVEILDASDIYRRVLCREK
jgi:hypothetical protein